MAADATQPEETQPAPAQNAHAAPSPGAGAVLADPPKPDGAVSIHTLPHAHGDHYHVGPAVVSVRDATGLGNPSVLNALARKGLRLRGAVACLSSRPRLDYDTGIAATSCTATTIEAGL